MKKEEIKELSTKELRERLDAAVVALNQLKINHSISPLDNPSQIKQDRKMGHITVLTDDTAACVDALESTGCWDDLR